LGHHSPSRRWRLDLIDQEVKCHCKLCGKVVAAPRNNRRRSSASNPHARRPFDGAAVALISFAGLLLIIGSAALWNSGTAHSAGSITVKLPPAHPAVPRPAFTFN
jgi:hypothetical protein